jgi:hypothetical protein
VEWSEGLSNRVSLIIRRYIDHMQFAAYMAVWFITFFRIILVLFCTYGCIFCVLLFDLVNCAFLLLSMFCSVYIPFHCVVLCTVCV